MAELPELLQRSFDALQPGEFLSIVGGTFPGANDRTHITVGLADIVEARWIVAGGEGGRRSNPVIEDARTQAIEVEIERGDKRFRHEPSAMDIRIGVAVAKVSDVSVDMLIADTTKGSYYFLRPTESPEARGT